MVPKPSLSTGSLEDKSQTAHFEMEVIALLTWRATVASKGLEYSDREVKTAASMGCWGLD